jgi:hypothetical protein
MALAMVRFFFPVGGCRGIGCGQVGTQNFLPLRNGQNPTCDSKGIALDNGQEFAGPYQLHGTGAPPPLGR